MRCREEERAPDKPGGVFNQNMGESFFIRNSPLTDFQLNVLK